jgi:hypothetical protein
MLADGPRTGAGRLRARCRVTPDAAISSSWLLWPDEAALAAGGDRLPRIDRCDVSPASGREGRSQRLHADAEPASKRRAPTTGVAACQLTCSWRGAGRVATRGSRPAFVLRRAPEAGVAASVRRPLGTESGGVLACQALGFPRVPRGEDRGPDPWSTRRERTGRKASYGPVLRLLDGPTNC